MQVTLNFVFVYIDNIPHFTLDLLTNLIGALISPGNYTANIVH